MRITYSVYLEFSLDTLLPGFWEGISEFEFCENLDRQNFRTRIEIARMEVEGVTEKNRGCGRQVVERAAKLLMHGHLQRILDDPLLRPEDASKMASIQVVEVENAPNPEWTHGLAGENPAVLCPICNSAMVRRSGRGDRPFWGCSRYPSCKGSRNISK